MPHDTTSRLDWRAYARDAGITPMHAWLACQRAIPHRPTGQTGVTSPASLDRICHDPAMHQLVRGIIDDAANS